MNRATRMLGPIAVIMAVATITQTASAQSSDERAIRAAGDAWQRYIRDQKVDSIVDIFTADAVFMLANSPPTKGSAALRSGWAELVKTPGLELSWKPDRIEVTSPTRATEFGTYTESYDTPSGKGRDSGTYITVWHKVNGKWKVAMDAPVSSMPREEPIPMESSDFVARSASAIAWSDLPAPGFPPGAKISVLHGDPSQAGRFVLRLSFPDGYQVPLHWHPTAEYVTVLSGGVNFAMGNAVDMTKAKSYAAGDFVFIPARHAHYLTTRGATIVEVSGNGPFQLNLGVPK